MRLGGRSGVAKQRATEERGSEREEARRRTRRSAEAAKKKRGSRGEARKQRRREESRKKKEEKTKVSMTLDDDRILSIFPLQTDYKSDIQYIACFSPCACAPGWTERGPEASLNRFTLLSNVELSKIL